MSVTPTHTVEIRPLTVSITDAARALSLSRASIYRLVSQGDLRTYKVGRRTLVKYEDLEALRDRLIAGRVTITLPGKRSGRAAISSSTRN